jgi:hypothetical protein
MDRKKLPWVINASITPDTVKSVAEAAEMDLQALAADYEATNMPCAAAELRRRVEHYREREITKV